MEFCYLNTPDRSVLFHLSPRHASRESERATRHTLPVSAIVGAPGGMWQWDSITLKPSTRNHRNVDQQWYRPNFQFKNNAAALISTLQNIIQRSFPWGRKPCRLFYFICKAQKSVYTCVLMWVHVMGTLREPRWKILGLANCNRETHVQLLERFLNWMGN